jgi:hypothetical protein
MSKIKKEGKRGKGREREREGVGVRDVNEFVRFFEILALFFFQKKTQSQPKPLCLSIYVFPVWAGRETIPISLAKPL